MSDLQEGSRADVRDVSAGGVPGAGDRSRWIERGARVLGDLG
jgi:hypothetical protein